MRTQKYLPGRTSEAPFAPAPVLPAHYSQAGFSMAQILALLRAHWRLSLTIIVLLLVTAVVGIKLMPKRYTATTAVLVNFESNESTRQANSDMFASYLATQVELLQSREVLLTVIDRLHLTADPEFATGYKDTGIATIDDWVEKGIRTGLAVELGKNSQLIYVSMTSKSRTKAADIANAIVSAYQSRQTNRGDVSDSGRAQEYSEQLNDLKGKVTAAEQRMAEFRQRTGITDLNAQNDVETQALNALEQQLLTAQNVRRSAEAKSIEDQGSSDQVMNSSLIQNLKNQRSALQAQLAELSSTLGPKHPKVLELQSQIASTDKALNREVQSFTQNNSSEVASSTQLEQRLQKAVADQNLKLVKTRAMQDEGQKLQLELDSAQTVYKRALDSYDQAMFASSSIASRATPPIEASQPNKRMLFALAALAALAIGLVFPAVYELLFNRRLHCSDDIERDLGLPVLAQLGPLPPEANFAI